MRSNISGGSGNRGGAPDEYDMNDGGAQNQNFNGDSDDEDNDSDQDLYN